MPATSPRPHVRPRGPVHARPPSDENLVITVIAVSLLAITVVGIGVYQFLQYQREQDSGKLLHVFSSTVKILGMRFISLSIVIRQLDAAILNGGDDC